MFAAGVSTMARSEATRFVVLAAVAMFAAVPVMSRGKPNAQTTITLIGELHGTVEMPRTFADLVKSESAKSRKPIAVGLELPLPLQPVLDQAVRERAHCEQVHQRLFQSESWRKINDGRSSEAMLQLVCDLVALAESAKIKLFVFDTEVAERNETMAAAIAAKVDSLKVKQVFILAGNLHASTVRDIPRYTSFHPMGWWLTQNGYQVRSFDIIYGAGDAWICTPECGIHHVNSRLPVPGNIPKHIGYDDVITLDHISASPPAIAGNAVPATQ